MRTALGGPAPLRFLVAELHWRVVPCRRTGAGSPPHRHTATLPHCHTSHGHIGTRQRHAAARSLPIKEQLGEVCCTTVEGGTRSFHQFVARQGEGGGTGLGEGRKAGGSHLRHKKKSAVPRLAAADFLETPALCHVSSTPLHTRYSDTTSTRLDHLRLPCSHLIWAFETFRVRLTPPCRSVID